MKDEAKVFYEVVWPHAAALLRVAQLLCRNEADAEDLVQDTLLKAHRKLHQFRPGTDARKWLLVILRNTRIDRLRAAGPSGQPLHTLPELEAEPAMDAAAPPEAWHDVEDLLERIGDQDLIDLLLELPEEIRWSLLLVDVEGLEQADAAAVMAVPVGTVKSRLHRGRNMLREMLQRPSERRR